MSYVNLRIPPIEISGSLGNRREFEMPDKLWILLTLSSGGQAWIDYIKIVAITEFVNHPGECLGAAKVYLAGASEPIFVMEPPKQIFNIGKIAIKDAVKQFQEGKDFI